MKVYACELCGYEYNSKVGDPENGILPGTDFEDLPEDWVCPLCGATKEDFEAIKKNKDYLTSLRSLKLNFCKF